MTCFLLVETTSDVEGSSFDSFDSGVSDSSGRFLNAVGRLRGRLEKMKGTEGVSDMFVAAKEAILHFRLLHCSLLGIFCLKSAERYGMTTLQRRTVRWLQFLAV